MTPADIPLPRLVSPEPLLDEAFAAAAASWSALVRRGDCLAFPLPGRYIAPGGFFDWFFYWDSYFTILGLMPCGQRQLARELVDGFVASIEDDGVRVRPFVNWDRLEYVRVVDYAPKGILDPAPPPEASTKS